MTLVSLNLMAEYSWRDPRKVLQEHSIHPSSRFSQNFLISPQVVQKISELSQPHEGRSFVELGPGLGTLSAALLHKGVTLTAIEADSHMIEVLKQEFPNNSKLHVIQGDAAVIRLSDLGFNPDGSLTLVGNLPYAITGPILRNLCRHATFLTRAVLMVQNEVADRLCAAPSSKAYGALTVFVQNLFAVRKAFIVKPGCFHPPPRVNSAVVCLQPRAAAVSLESPLFRQIVRAAFDARRKTLSRALRTGSQWDSAQVENLLRRSGIDPKRRGETLSVVEFAALAEQAQALGLVARPLT